MSFYSWTVSPCARNCFNIIVKSVSLRLDNFIFSTKYYILPWTFIYFAIYFGLLSLANSKSKLTSPHNLKDPQSRTPGIHVFWILKGFHEIFCAEICNWLQLNFVFVK